jgi:Tol biopolymer transport system component/tetratricopeptide (TPR) repeat protein
VKLLDFGIAKLLGGDGAGGPAALTLTNERFMTPRYASPEQVAGDAVSTASDVYALGVLLHELLTGRDPYRLPSQNSYEVVHAVLEREPERASLSVARAGADYDPAVVARARGTTPVRLQRHLTGDLDMIVLTALQKDPARRYSSVEQLQADLERHLTGLPIAARGDGRLYRARKFVRRHTAGVAAAAIFALVVVGFAVLTGVQAVRIRAEARHAREERISAEEWIRFVAGVFGNAVPSPQAGRGMNSREFLDTSAARIHASPLPPRDRSRIMYDIGRAYHQLGSDDRAQPFLEEALAIRRTLRPTTGRELDETLQALGDVLLDRKDLAGAEWAYEGALTLRRSALDSAHRDVARTLNGLSTVRLGQGRGREAEELAREALAIDRQRSGDTRLDVAQSLRSLGEAVADRGADREAQVAYRESLALLRQVRPYAYLVMARTLLDLSASLARTGDRLQSDSLQTQGVALLRELATATGMATLQPLELPELPRVPPSTRRLGVTAPTFDSKIVFVSDRSSPDPVGHLGNNEIFIMNPDGSDQRRLASTGVFQGLPVLSPDGRRIAFQAAVDGGMDIFLMNVDGTGKKRLTNLTAMRLAAARPAWSPDGNKIAFNSRARGHVFVINADGTQLTNLTEKQPGSHRGPSWSPDGRHIVFESTRDGQPGIYVMNADGTNPALLLGHPVAPRAGPAWSPDGRYIAFASNPDGRRFIYRVNADGTGLVRLTVSPTDDDRPQWSPDGRQIVFHRSVMGHNQIFVIGVDGGEPRRLTELSRVAFNGFASWGRVTEPADATPRQAR